MASGDAGELSAAATPAEKTSRSCSRSFSSEHPRRSLANRRKTASARGLRQVFPVHTNKILKKPKFPTEAVFLPSIHIALAIKVAASVVRIMAGIRGNLKRLATLIPGKAIACGSFTDHPFQTSPLPSFAVVFFFNGFQLPSGDTDPLFQRLAAG